MHVQSTSGNDLEAMLDAPPQSDGSRETRAEDFEANLELALLGSIDPENPEEVSDRRIAEGVEGVVEEIVDDGLAAFEIEAIATDATEATEGPLAMAPPTAIAHPMSNLSTPIEGDESGATAIHPRPLASDGNPNLPSPSLHVRDESNLLAPAPEHPTPTRDQPTAVDPARTAMSEPGLPPANSIAVARAEGLETAGSVRRVAEPGSMPPVAPEAVGFEAKRQSSPRDSVRSTRGAALGSARAEIDRVLAPDARSKPEGNSSEMMRAAETLPRMERLANEVPYAAERVFASPTPPGIPPTPAIDILANGIPSAPLNAEPTAETTLPQPVQAIPRNVELLASRGGGTARLRLHPAELGEVDITVSIRGDVVNVIIHADEPAARAAVMAHREQLAESLGTRDLRLQGFDVTSGGREQGAEDRQAQWGGTDGRPGQQSPAFGTPASNTQDTRIIDRAAAAAASLQRRGIDLRI